MAGTYATACSGASDLNYQLTYVAGTLSVVPLVITVTASWLPARHASRLDPMNALREE